MKAIEFKNKVAASFAKYFPNGFTDATKMDIDNGTHFCVGMIGKIEGQLHSLKMNDPLTIRFAIEDLPFNGEDDLGNAKLVVEFNGSTLSTKPVSQYKAMDREKIPARKLTNTPEKVLAALDKYFAKVHDTVKAQAAIGNIYSQERIPSQYLPA